MRESGLTSGRSGVGVPGVGVPGIRVEELGAGVEERGVKEWAGAGEELEPSC